MSDTHPRPIDYARMSRIMLGFIADDIDSVNRALLEADAEDAVNLLLAAFAITLGDAMQQPAMDLEGVRRSFEGAIVAIQMDGDSG